MKYLHVDNWDAVLAMFGDGGKFAGAWGFLEVLRQAELGNSAEVDSSGIAKEGWRNTTTLLKGIFTEQDGDLMLSLFDQNVAVDAGILGYIGHNLGEKASYWVDGSHFIANRKHNHIVYHTENVDNASLGLGIWSMTADFGMAAALGGAASGDIPLALAGAAYWVGGTAAGWVNLGRTQAQYQRGEASRRDLQVAYFTTLEGTIPGVGMPADVTGLVYELSKGLYVGP